MDLDERREKVAQMSRSIFQYCLSRTGSYQESEDLSQEILLALCESVEHLRDEGAFYAFVWRTADNILKGWYRKKRERRIAEPDEMPETLPDDVWERLAEQMQENEQLALISRELSLLNSNYRRVTVAYYVDDLSVNEISVRFSLTQSMVKYLLFQSRKRIKEGVAMERNFGKLSYDPVELEMSFWGENNYYYDKFNDKLKQNIIMSCYYDKQTEEQIALQLGVPTAYLADELKVLLEYDLICEKNGFYYSNIPVITREIFDALRSVNKGAVEEIAEGIREEIDSMAEAVRAIGFYGSDMPLNSLKWMLVSLILHLAYIDMLHGEQTLDFPTDVFGEKCFRWFEEKSASDPYSFGTSVRWSRDGMLLFWDVNINGEKLHARVTKARADMAGSLLKAQPQTETEKLVCSELVELRLAVKTEDGIKPNFPCLTREQGDALNAMIVSIGREICQNLLSRTDSVKKILIDRTPAHLMDYVSKMPILMYFSEAKEVMQQLCESGWLLPWLPRKSGMSPTTVMYLLESDAPRQDK